MFSEYPSTVKRFGVEDKSRSLTMMQAVQALNANEADAIVLDIESPESIDQWWDDEGFTSSPFTKNAHHAGIVATSVTLGQLQRETDEKLMLKSAEYFGVASRVNPGLQSTRFVNFFEREVDAAPLTMEFGYDVEFLSATRRLYEPYEARFNFAPHCDDISFGRDQVNWPFKHSYARQLGAFLTIQGSENDAGMVMWSSRPESRARLDQINDEYREKGYIAELEQADSIELKPQPGQLTVFQSKYLHAIEKCESRRRTMGLFLINDGSKWRYFD